MILAIFNVSRKYLKMHRDQHFWQVSVEVHFTCSYSLYHHLASALTAHCNLMVARISCSHVGIEAMVWSIWISSFIWTWIADLYSPLSQVQSLFPPSCTRALKPSPPELQSHIHTEQCCCTCHTLQYMFRPLLWYCGFALVQPFSAS